MASQDRAATHIVEFENNLQAAPYKYSFFQAIRRLECVYKDKPRLGQSPLAKDDPIRLAQQPSMKFAAASLASFQQGKNGLPPRLAVNFLGLLGPNGPLPLHLTDYIHDRLHNGGDATLSRFLDIFHHRMLSLFYRAWANAQPTVNYDRPETDRFAMYVGALMGIGMPSLRHRDAIPDYAKLHHAGHFSCQTHHAEGLQSIIAHFFHMPVSIEQFVGHWLSLSHDSQWQLGRSAQNSELGVLTTLGDRVWDCQSKFRLVLGPLNYQDFKNMLPGKQRLQRLKALVRQYIGDELVWDIKIILKKQETPMFQLGETSQLGLSTWLINESPLQDVDNLVLE